MPLAPFKGNRFNIVFHNGGDVYYLKDDLKDFVFEHKDDNQLLKAVYYDLSVPQFLSGCRALGLINKIVTTPLWKVLESNVHVNTMTQRYITMLEKFEEWAQDSTPLLNGTAVLFDDVLIERDDVFNSLVETNDDDKVTQQMLELLFSSYVMITNRLLGEHVIDDVYEGNEAETKSVPKTNTSVECDFGMLDRLIREKPKASNYAVESLIMY